VIVNPYSEYVPVIPGTRMLATDYGLTGAEIVDITNDQRTWTAVGFYAPVPERCLGGIRIKLLDQKGFTTFCNQRDFEILLGIAKPGDFCKWTGKPYPHPHDDDDWFGLCMDLVDLQDDLFERELALRAETAALPESSEILRRIHPNTTRDGEDYWILLRDHDMMTGVGPDTRIETLYDRWSCVSRDWLDWMRV